MSSIRNIVKVFLASPGDLSEERRAAKGVVDEFNITWAEQLGYQVQLVGWEDTLSVWGRPQETINRDLVQCELFIGLMWKKWGTPPSESGPYTSGFEEEFRTSAERRKSLGRPEISLFFKSVPEDLLADPGDELKKVLAFRSELISSKEILFQNFSDIAEFEQLLRRRISSYVQTLVRADDAVEEDADSPSGRTSDILETQARPLELGGALFTDQENAFFQELLSRSEGQEIFPSDAARLQLISHALSTSSNDRDALGPHDANLVFGTRNSADLSVREKFILLEAGLARIEQQNAPLWFWLFSITGDPAERLVIESFAGPSDAVRIGAIKTLTLAEYPIKDYDWQVRHGVIETWLAEKENSSVKAAALSYLAKCGRSEDLELLRAEWARGDHATSRPAGEAIIAIGLREGRTAALHALIDVQLETMRHGLLDEVDSVLEIASNEELELILAHRNAEVRLSALREIGRRGSGSLELLEQVTKDASPDVRFAALRELERRGRAFDLGEAKSILVKPKRNALAWSFADRADSRSEANWNEHRLATYSKMGVEELLEIYRKDAPLEPWAYLGLARKHKLSSPFDVRQDLRDQFMARFESMIDIFEKHYGAAGSELVARTRKLTDFSRKELYRRSLTLLCEMGSAADIGLVRECADSGFGEAGIPEIRFLHKHGDWSDIPRISQIADRTGGLGLLDQSARTEALEAAAQAIIRLAGSRVEEMANLPLSSGVLEKILLRLSNAKIKQISADKLQEFFLSTRDSLRRVASLRAVQSLSKARVADLLDNYESIIGSRYYNVAFWLDLGVSVPDGKTRAKVSANALESFY